MLEKNLNIPADGVGRKQAEAFADLCDRTLSPATARARVALLKSAWDWAGKNSQCQLPQQNPWDGIGDRWSRYQQPKSPAAFTAAEVARIIAGFRNSPYYSHYADFVFFQLNLATRPGNFRTRAWAKVLESLGIPYRKPYTTRKTCITHIPVQKTTPTTSNGDGGCG